VPTGDVREGVHGEAIFKEDHGGVFDSRIRVFAQVVDTPTQVGIYGCAISHGSVDDEAGFAIGQSEVNGVLATYPRETGGCGPKKKGTRGAHQKVKLYVK
jgi:hypothetical protein